MRRYASAIGVAQVKVTFKEALHLSLGVFFLLTSPVC